MDPHDAVIVFPPPMDRMARLYPAPHFLCSYLAGQGFRAKTVDLNLAAFLALARQEEATPKPRGRFPMETPKSCRDLMDMALKGIRYTRLYRQPFQAMFGWLYYTRDLSCRDILDEARRPEMKQMTHMLDPAIRREILPAKAPVIGFSIPFSQQLIPAVALAARIKALTDKVHICFGGPAVTLTPEPCLEEMSRILPVDSFVRYEGEYPLAALVRSLKPGPYPEKVIPPSSRLRYNFNRFGQATLAQMPKGAPIPVRQATGCYWKRCTFCDYINLHQDKTYIPRTVDKVISDMQYYTQAGFYNFRLLTEAIPPDHAMALAKAILRQLPKIHWHAFIRVDKGFTSGIFKALKQSGFSFTVGMESVNDPVLARLNKGYDRKTIAAFAENLKAANFGGNHLNVMIGIPGERYEEALETLAFCTDCKDLFSLFKPSRFTLTATSYMGRHPEEFGIWIRPRKRPHHPDRAGGRLSSLAFDDPSGMVPDQIAAIFKAYEKLNRSIHMDNEGTDEKGAA